MSLVGMYKRQTGKHISPGKRNEYKLSAVQGCVMCFDTERGILSGGVAATARAYQWVSDEYWNNITTVRVLASGPQYLQSTPGFEGRPTLYYDRTLNNFMITSTVLTLAQPITLLVVMNRTDYAADVAAKSYIVSTANNFTYNVSSDNKDSMYAGTANIKTSDNATKGTWQVHAVRYDGANSNIMINGDEKVTGNPGASGIVAQTFAIGDVPGAANEWQNYDGYIKTVAFFNRAIANDEMRVISEALMRKYNI